MTKATRHMEISALNITIHPHSPQLYIDMLNDAVTMQLSDQKSKKFLHIRGQEKAFLSPVLTTIVDGQTCLYGHVYRFFDLDISGGWLDIASGKEAQKEDLTQINIPDHLKPYVSGFYFIFFPNEHRLIFQSSARPSHKRNQVRFSPHSAQMIFDQLFEKLSKQNEKYDNISVTVEQSPDALDNIWKLEVVRSLEIVITRPNNDDISHLDNSVKRRLEKMNASKMTETLSAEKGKSIVPDEDVKNLAAVALSNGYVEGTGKDAHGSPKKISTKFHPVSEVISYNHSIQIVFDAFLEGAKQLTSKLSSRLKT